MLKLFISALILFLMTGCGPGGCTASNPPASDDGSASAAEPSETVDPAAPESAAAPVDEDPEAALAENLEVLSETVKKPSSSTIPEKTKGKIIVENVVELDKTVHDFGDILLSDGPVSCSFSVKNIGKDPIAIYEVVSSCGCTAVEWTREPLQSGKSGKITATFENADGPIPFDKNLTIYISGLGKPVILKLRGYAHEKEYSLEELFGAYRFGPIGMKENDIKVGNLEQGHSRSEEVQIANLGRKSAKLTFTDVSEHLTISVSPNPIPASSKAVLTLTVDASRDLWGKNYYYATPVVNGTAPGGKISAWAYTKEDFSALTSEQRAAGSQPFFNNNSLSFDRAAKG
ncbi:MAG: DUF1573 domain-containing protein, partial [Bacteroidales bacterium]|nr:DUF1573 domain-containing protein [Bacteroidales bacterium]